MELNKGSKLQKYTFLVEGEGEGPQWPLNKNHKVSCQYDC